MVPRGVSEATMQITLAWANLGTPRPWYKELGQAAAEPLLFPAFTRVQSDPASGYFFSRLA